MQFTLTTYVIYLFQGKLHTKLINNNMNTIKYSNININNYLILFYLY
jgi:hypothetical protein